MSKIHVETDEQFEERKVLIDKIIFACKVSNVSDNKMIPLDDVWMNLLGLDIPGLKNVATELNIAI